MDIWDTVLRNIILCLTHWLILRIIWQDCWISLIWSVLSFVCWLRNICGRCISNILRNILACCCVYNCKICSGCYILGLWLWDRIQYFLGWTNTHDFTIKIRIELSELANREVKEWRVIKPIHHVKVLYRWNICLHPLSII